MREGQSVDYKSLRALDATAELAKDCVAFANARGGCLLIGIEDGEEQPPDDQRVGDDLLQRLQLRLAQKTVNVTAIPEKVVADNGGEYISLVVASTAQSVAATTDGRYFMRVDDQSRPLMPEDLTRLLSEKTAYSWEALTLADAPAARIDGAKSSALLERIKASSRVTPFVKDKTDGELYEYYQLTREGRLTNLGVLWIGIQADRARLRYAPSVQCIKYDEQGRKAMKWEWTDFSLNPYELLEAVLHDVPEWRESYEFPDGLFRTLVPHYDDVVVRELVANALAHRPYTQAGDIFVNLHPDCMEVHNPGLLPLSVTPKNILHMSVRRNEHLSRLFYDLGLMEREGSGYDRMYEVLLTSGRPAPRVEETRDSVRVTVHKRVGDPDVLEFVGKAEEAFSAISQKEKIVLGLLAQHESMTALELRSCLDLREPGEFRPWLGRLVEWKLVTARGKAKGTRYSVNPDLLRSLHYKGGTSLKGIEPPRLRELILRDLGIHREAAISEIHKRIGEEIPLRDLRRQLKRLVDEGAIGKKGAKRGTRYLWKGQSE